MYTLSRNEFGRVGGKKRVKILLLTGRRKRKNWKEESGEAGVGGRALPGMQAGDSQSDQDDFPFKSRVANLGPDLLNIMSMSDLESAHCPQRLGTWTLHQVVSHLSPIPSSPKALLIPTSWIIRKGKGRKKPTRAVINN